jgi:ankyrin repeat protein
MESLYHDVLSTILLRLGYKDICKMSLLSKKFYNLITEDLPEKIYQTKYGVIRNDKITFMYLNNLKTKKNNLKDKTKIFYWCISNGFDELLKRVIVKVDIDNCINDIIVLIENSSHEECLNILLSYFNDVNANNMFNYCVRKENYLICKLLFDAGRILDNNPSFKGNVIKYCYSDITISETDPSNALYLSCKYNKYKNAKHILNTYENIDSRYEKNGMTYLDHAVFVNNVKMVKVLLKRSYHYILKTRHCDCTDKIIKILLQYKVILYDSELLDFLILNSYAKTIKFVLQNYCIDNKEKVLETAVKRSSCYVVKLLLDTGINVGSNLKYALNKKLSLKAMLLCKYTNNYDEDDLLIACKNGQLNIVKYLVGNGVKIVPKVFHNVCCNITDGEELIKFFIETGIDINMKDEDGTSAIYNAYMSHNYRVVDLLKELGCNNSLSEAFYMTIV